MPSSVAKGRIHPVPQVKEGTWLAVSRNLFHPGMPPRCRVHGCKQPKLPILRHKVSYDTSLPLPVALAKRHFQCETVEDH